MRCAVLRLCEESSGKIATGPSMTFSLLLHSGLNYSFFDYFCQIKLMFLNLSFGRIYTDIQ